MMSRQFLGFLLVSAIAAAANFGSRIVFSLWMPYVPAIVLAFCVGLTTAFFLNRTYVFRDGKHGMARQAAWFTFINLVALVQTIVVSLLLARWLLPRLGWTWHAEEIAHAIGVVFPVASSYVGHRALTFRK